jgi:hypothetical protein
MAVDYAAARCFTPWCPIGRTSLRSSKDRYLASIVAAKDRNDGAFLPITGYGGTTQSPLNRVLSSASFGRHV